ncbi:porin OmpC [Hafnia paralvei]|uniref:Porin OmpC n=1 Tax=Hafnia paralvei TaxID=546367 RepID=A0A2A2MAS7_9GAMM|nr:porin OmpC [Hafnia paralvei]KHS50459.1 porin [Hafnia paralvei]PAV95781.1 porin OmpC [Hafnia paralvei]TBL49993.1 porin OmpC [Hafnia paralvei]
MKISKAVVIVSILSVSGLAHAAEIYNHDGNKLDLNLKADGLHYFSKDKSADGDQSYIRFGFRGETQINDQLTGYGQWEYQVMANTPETQNDAYTRLGFAGLKYGNFGSIDYGRNYGVLYDIASWTDMLPEFGDNTYEAEDNFMTNRSSGLLTYRNSGFFGLVDGLNIAAQYQGKNGACTSDGGCSNGTSGRSISEQNGDGYGMAMTYDLGWGISAGAAYTNSNRTLQQQRSTLANGKRAEAWTAGMKYDANNVYIAATYAQTRNMTYFSGSRLQGVANKTDNWELVAQYQFDNGLRPSLAYLQSRGESIGRYGDMDLVKYADVATTYYFNKNMSAYVDYKINLLDSNNRAGINSDNIVATGLVYQF